ncbi:transposase [Ochrobactrum pseudogrignonense]|nr:transposase [Brucella pseudogrignonensis]
MRKLRRYTPEERSSLLAAVGSETAAGKTLKDTLVKLNLSEQTYYNWKNDGQSKAKPAAAKAATKSAPAKASKPKAAAAKAPFRSHPLQRLRQPRLPLQATISRHWSRWKPKTSACASRSPKSCARRMLNCANVSA